MAAAKHNIIIEKKATFTKDFQLFSTYLGKDNVGNVAINLTGATVACKIKKKITDSAAVITMDTAIVNALQGRFRISLSAAQTASLSFDTGVYDILVTFPSGTVEKFIEGTVVLDRTVS